jgi:acyl carrier protein
MKAKKSKKEEIGTSIEMKVGAIWKRQLGINGIKAQSDFFEMGGDSILALNMLFEVGAAFAIDLPPGILFENPTLGAFCSAVASLQAEHPRAKRR